MPGDYLDLSSEPAREREATVVPARTITAANDAEARKFVGIHFVCCDVYSRIYVNRAGTAYSGNCPRCAKRIDLKIGPGGTDHRFFTAG